VDVVDPEGKYIEEMAHRRRVAEQKAEEKSLEIGDIPSPNRAYKNDENPSVIGTSPGA
jgi:hypothetical protein